MKIKEYCTIKSKPKYAYKMECSENIKKIYFKRWNIKMKIINKENNRYS